MSTLKVNTIQDTSGNTRPSGITEADQWRVTSNFNSYDTVITSNWERNDTDFALIGSGMTESSGVFTFPATGIYRIDFKLGFYKSDHRRYIGAVAELSTNSGGSYADLTRSYVGLYDVDSNNSQGTSTALTHVDVQDASTYRVRFKAIADSPVTVYGANDDIRTTVMFERIANT